MADQVTVVEQGDWLIPYKCEEPHKVRQISYQEEPAGKWTIITFEGKDFWETWYYPASCMPIPLTKEILEKNGFENIGDDIYQLTEKPYWFWVDFYNHEYGCEYDTSTYEYEDSERRLKLYGIPYVHELQHAMRLCGIEMKFEL